MKIKVCYKDHADRLNEVPCMRADIKQQITYAGGKRKTKDII